MLIVKIVSGLAGAVIGFVVVSSLFKGGDQPVVPVVQNDGPLQNDGPGGATGAESAPARQGGSPAAPVDLNRAGGGAGAGSVTPDQKDLEDQAIADTREAFGGNAAATMRDAAGDSVAGPGLAASAKREIDAGWSTVVTIENPAEAGTRLKAVDVAPRPVSWNVEPDALAAPVEYSERPISVPVQSGSSIWFPPAPSNMMAIGKLPRDFQIVSLKELQPVHSPKVEDFGATKFSLSPDGSRFASLVRKQSESFIQVFDSASGQLAGELAAKQGLFYYFEFLDNDRLLASYPDAPGESFSGQALPIHVFSVQGGQSLFSVELGGAESAGIRLSANRQLAACVNAEKHLVICDLETGKRLGDVEIPEPPMTAARPEAAGFSQDGQNFALLAWNSILNWDVETGRLTHRHNGTRETYPPSSGEDRALVEFVGIDGDDEAWLLGGLTLVDRESGVPVWSASERRFGTRYPARLLPGEKLLDVQDTDVFSGRLQLTSLSGQARSIEDSEVTEFDRTVALHPAVRKQPLRGTKVSLPDGDVAWGAGPVAALATEQFEKMVGLGGTGVSKYVVRGSAAMAQREINTFQVPEAFKSYPGFRQARSVSLEDGETIGTAPIRNESTPVAISPSGRTGVAVSGRQEKAIDIFDFAASRHVASVDPFEDWTWRNLTTSLKFTLLDDTRLLMKEALREDSALTLFELPAMRVRYQVALAPREVPRPGTDNTYKVQPVTLAASHDGKYVAVADGSRIRMLDAETGKVAGDLLLPELRDSGINPPSATLGAFSPNGQQFVAWIPGSGQNFVCSWNLSDGQVADVFPLTHSSLRIAIGFSCVDDDLVALQTGTSHSLVSRSRRCAVWQLEGVAKFAGGSFYHFVDTDSSSGTATSVLVSLPVPPEDVAAAMQSQLPEARVMLSRGGSVKLEQGQYSGGVAADFSQTVLSAVTGNLQAAGISVDPSAKQTLRLSMKQGATENVQREYRQTFGGGGTQTYSFSVTSYELSAELVDSSGAVVWSRGDRVSNGPPLFTITKQNSNLQAELTRQGNDGLKNSIESFFTKLQLPETVYYQPLSSNGSVAGLGSSRIGWNSESSPATAATAVPRPNVPGVPQLLGQPGAAAQDEPQISEAELLAKCRELVNSAYGDILSSDEASWGMKLKWSPALKRAVAGLRWGLGVQFQKPPANVKIEIQPKRKDMLDLLGKASAGAGPALVQEIESVLRAGQMSNWPSSASVAAKETILLGSGSQSELLAASRKARLDFIAIAYFGQGRGRQARESTMEFRLLDCSTGATVFKSDALKASQLGATGVDLAAELAGKVATFVKSDIVPAADAELDRAAVGERMRLLAEQASANPMAELMEIRFYLSQQLTSEAAALRAAQKVLTEPSEARTIVSGDTTARSELVKQLTDQWK